MVHVEAISVKEPVTENIGTEEVCSLAEQASTSIMEGWEGHLKEIYRYSVGMPLGKDTRKCAPQCAGARITRLFDRRGVLGM